MLNELRLKSLAPKECPKCQAERSFKILPDKMVCRRCGYTIQRTDDVKTDQSAVPLATPAADSPYGPRKSIPTPSYSVQFSGELSKWAKAAYDTGIMHLMREEWEDAAKAFLRALETQRDFIDAHYWLAMITRDPDKKREHLSTIIAYQPGHSSALRELMVLNGALDAADEAVLDNPFYEPELRDAGGAVSVSSTNVRCSRCGAPNMTTDDVTGLLYCKSCGHVDEKRQPQKEGGGILMMALLKRRSQAVKWVIGQRLLACESCGAERTVSSTKLSSVCPYCGSTHIFEKDALDSFEQPEGLVPFAITQDEAEEAIRTQLKSWFERFKGWFDNNRIERATLEGHYIPYWVFDVQTSVRRTIIRDPNKGNSSYKMLSTGNPPNMYQTETFLDSMFNVRVSAVKSPSRRMTDKLGKFDMGNMLRYESKLLAKHPAQIYSIDVDVASLHARSVVSDYMRMRHDIPVGEDTKVSISTTPSSMSYQLVLLPVWVATLHEVDGDVRNALVNGQTGKVVLGKTHKPGVGY